MVLKLQDKQRLVFSTIKDFNFLRHVSVHYSDVKMGAMAFIQTQVKENIKAPRHWPLWGEFTVVDRWIPRTKGQ